jgi:hypothetical protein
MASLPGDRLTEAQRADQARRAARLAADIARNFRGVQMGDLNGQRNFVEASIPLVLRANRDAARSARTYAITMSSLEGGLADEVQLADPPDLDAIRTSLRVTGPIALRQKVTRIQVPLDQPAGQRLVAAARQEATAAVAGAAVRHAMDGGRDTIREYADAPKGKRIRGYVRVTRMDDKVCYFCAMLASRANYLEDSFDVSDQLFEGEGTAKVHDSCRCILRPMYGSVLPDSVLMYRRAWSAMSGGDKDAVNNFRSNWTHRSADWDKAAA